MGLSESLECPGKSLFELGRKTLEFLSRAVNWNWAFSKRRDNAMAEIVQPVQSVLTGLLQGEEEPEEEESLLGQ